jgi:hypothetical protein
MASVRRLQPYFSNFFVCHYKNKLIDCLKAFTDFISLLFLGPYWLQVIFSRWLGLVHMPGQGCHLISLVTHICGMVSILTYFSISLERYACGGVLSKK